MKLENCEIKRYGGAFLTAPEAAQLLHISTSHAYKVIHRLNQELKARGFLTIAGRISGRVSLNPEAFSRPLMLTEMTGM